LHLSELYIYPIKSAKGIPLTSARLDACGLEFDRRWMVVDEQGNFLTQRRLPRMALIHVQIQSDHLVVQADGISALAVPFHSPNSTPTRVQIWDDSLGALDIGDAPASWFSEFLKQPCRLVQMLPQSERFVNPKYSPVKSPVSFPDGFPLLLISQASLDDLNSRLVEPVPMNRFRPNIVVEGCTAYEEDSWRSLRIGAVSLRVAKPCARCTIPTVNQDTGDRGKDPILTLESYRRRDGKVYFGQNLIHKSQGILKIGDAVETVIA
jgi:uncharacterized protein YcbX